LESIRLFIFNFFFTFVLHLNQVSQKFLLQTAKTILSNITQVSESGESIYL